MGSIGKQPPRPLLSPYRNRSQTTPGRDPRLGANCRHHRALFQSQSRGPAMRFLRRFFIRLSNFATGKRAEQRLREEMAEHVALQTEENMLAGMSPAEARRQAV